VNDRRRNGLILLLVLGILVASGVAIATKKTVLGLDLKGGVELVFQGKPSSAQPKVTQSALDRAVDIMRKRVDQLGVSEPEIQRSARDQISVGMPGVSNEQRAIKQVGTPAQLAFYDYEADLLGPDNKPVAEGLNASDQTAVTLSQASGDPQAGLSLYDAAKQASKRKPINDGNNFRLGPQYWSFEKDKAHTYVAGPDDSLTDLRSDEQAKHIDGGTEVLKINPGTLILQAVDRSAGSAPPDNRPDLAKWYVFNDNPSVLGKDIKDPRQEFDDGPGGSGEPIVTFKFTDTGQKEFQDVTKTVAQRGANTLLPGAGPGDFEQHFAIALDRKLISVATIDPKRYPEGIDGSNGAQIQGGFTITSAQDLANQIKYGALPINLKLISQSKVSASLGKEALHQGLLAGAVGLALVMFFLLFYYRVLGLIAAGALIVYGVYFYALIKLIPITLTLPGIAGLILTIGVAADANIVIFERVKEEVRAGRSVPAGIAAGYKKGLTAIVDANVVTIMTAFILFILATAGVKGFAFTLGIGTIVSLFTAVLATQAILGTMGRSRLLASRAALGASGEGRHSRFDFMGASKWFFSISGVILLIGALAIGARGLEFGIDFESGTRIESAFVKTTDEDGVRTVMSAQGYPDAKIQRVSNAELGSNAFQIRVPQLQPDQLARVKSALNAKLGVNDQKYSAESIGPTFGQTVARSAVLAIIASLLVISAYIALRFEWKYAVPVLIALMHDLLITAGVYSLTGREVTTSTVAALLTILGYSLYDTIIVFDRVRENVPRMPRAAFSQIVNRSMSEVLNRSLATSFCTLLPILALLLFGGETLKDFAFALFVGVASGAYSSIFIASPVLTHWKEREPVWRQRHLRLEAEYGAVPAYATTRAGAIEDVEPERKRRGRRPARVTEPPPEGVSPAEFEEMKRNLDLPEERPAPRPERPPRATAVAPRPRRAPKPGPSEPSAPEPDTTPPAGDGFERAADEPENEGMLPKQPKPKKPRNRRHGRRR
jgi:SecD/SecF fusion protein